MKRIKIGQIGIGHNHGAAKMDAVRKFPELFEVVGYAESSEYWQRERGGLANYEGLTRYTEEELVEKKVKIRNSEKITKNSEFVYRALKGSEKGSVSYLLDRSVSALSQISDVVEEFGEYSEKLREILYQVDDIAESVYDSLCEIDEDPTETLNKIESRLDHGQRHGTVYPGLHRKIQSILSRLGARTHGKVR